MDKYCDRHCRMKCSYYGIIPPGFVIINGVTNNSPIRCPFLSEKAAELDAAEAIPQTLKVVATGRTSGTEPNLANGPKRGDE